MSDDNFLPQFDDQLVDPYVERVKKKVGQLLQKLPWVTGFQAGMGAAGAGIIIACFFYAMELVITVVAFIGTPLVTFFLRVITKLRTDTIPEQLEISASVLSEFLATEITPEQMKPGKGADASIAAANQIGGGLLDRLEKEFTNGKGVTPESGAAAARTFAGYAVNFAVQNTIISTLADAVSFHMLEQFRELGVEVAQNIGLGRLVRSALKPLTDTTIAKPYTRQLNYKYRQDLLSESLACNAYFRGEKTLDQVKLELAWKGYTDADILSIINDHRPDLTVSEMYQASRFGELDQQTAVTALVAKGYTEAQAKLKFRNEVLNRLESLENTFLDAAESKYTNGFIDLGGFNKALDATHLTEEEKRVRLMKVGMILDAGQRRASLSEMQTMLNDGIVTTADVADWLDAQNYSPKDQLPLFYLFLAKFDAAAEKAAAVIQKQATGRYKHLTLTQIAKYFKEQQLTSADVTLYVKELGYDPTVTAMLIATVLALGGDAQGAAAAQAQADQLAAQIPLPPPPEVS